MYNFSKKAIQSNIDELTSLRDWITNELEKSPTGSIQVQKTPSGATFFKHVQYVNGVQSKKHLSKNDEAHINSLCNKKYYKDVLPAIKDEINALSHFQSAYDPLKKYEVYRNLHPEKQKFVRPLFETVQSKVEAWKERPYKPLKFKENEATYDTDHGEKVRSKSEYMIANELNRRSSELLYRYEQPLKLGGATIYPDFEIISLKSGKVYYYEHFGRMDDPEYFEGFVSKMQRYQKGGVLLGQSLIATFETKEKPLHLSQIKAALEIAE